MAHELEQNEEGTSFFQVVREGVALAWHNLGKYFTADERPNTTAEALKLCRGDFEVEVRPQTYTAYTSDGDTYQRESTLSAAIVRTDNNVEVGSATPGYTVMQFSEAMRNLDPFIGEGLATIETAGVFRNGDKAFMLMRWNIERFGDLCREAFGDSMRAYGLATASHSGRDGICFYDTDVTVVCQNTERAAVNGSTSKFMAKHSRKAGTRVVDGVTKLWGGVVAQREEIGRAILALRSLTLDEATFRAMVLDVIAPLPQESKSFDPNAKFANTMVRRAEEKRLTLSSLWHNAPGHVGDGSAWEAYKAVTHAADHSGVLWSPRSLESRAEGLLEGPMVTAKNAVYNGLLELATAGK